MLTAIAGCFGWRFIKSDGYSIKNARSIDAERNTL
jgi:hypothetical protein